MDSQEKRQKLAQSFNVTFRYMDDVLLLSNFAYRIYPIELEQKMDITDTDMYASYLDQHLEIDSERRLRTKLDDKRNYLNFHTFHYM